VSLADACAPLGPLGLILIAAPALEEAEATTVVVAPPLFKVRGLKADVKEDAEDGAPAPVAVEVVEVFPPLGLDMTIS